MKKLILILLLPLFANNSNSQTCDELMDYVKSKAYGQTFYSYSSDAISQVTFYDVFENYETYYFAIVCFKKEYYGCTEYLYQVGSNTRYQYSMNYHSSAGKAFWNYIEPYNSNLGCAPSFE